MAAARVQFLSTRNRKSGCGCSAVRFLQFSEGPGGGGSEGFGRDLGGTWEAFGIGRSRSTTAKGTTRVQVQVQVVAGTGCCRYRLLQVQLWALLPVPLLRKFISNQSFVINQVEQ